VDASSRDAAERELTRLCDGGAWEDAATLLIRSYGPELLGLLCALHRDESDASEVFSRLCEVLWRGLPGFERRASFRTWAYATARRLSARFHRDEGARRRRLAGDEALEDLEARVRTQTLSILRSQVKSRLDELRASLPREDQLLLILRYDRDLDWSDLARVMHDDDHLDEDALKRESARLRKRFQLVKERLREQVEREGLLGK
jgi:RNA polymerase sigma-70 factor, ECF subfamily